VEVDLIEIGTENAKESHTKSKSNKMSKDEYIKRLEAKIQLLEVHEEKASTSKTHTQSQLSKEASTQQKRI